jgi:hypothetical protein
MGALCALTKSTGSVVYVYSFIIELLNCHADPPSPRVHGRNMNLVVAVTARKGHERAISG